MSGHLDDSYLSSRLEYGCLKIMIIVRAAKREPENFRIRKPVLQLALNLLEGLVVALTPSLLAHLLRKRRIAAKSIKADQQSCAEKFHGPVWIKDPPNEPPFPEFPMNRT